MAWILYCLGEEECWVPLLILILAQYSWPETKQSIPHKIPWMSQLLSPGNTQEALGPQNKLFWWGFCESTSFRSPSKNFNSWCYFLINIFYSVLTYVSSYFYKSIGFCLVHHVLFLNRLSGACFDLDLDCCFWFVVSVLIKAGLPAFAYA